MKKKLLKGFTLIELLVVIAIIGILASIIMVSLSSARNKAKDAKIQSDIRSVMSAIEIFKTDDANDAAPATLAALKNAGLLKEDPKDAAGDPYQNGYTLCPNTTEYVLSHKLNVKKAGKDQFYYAKNGTTGTAEEVAPACD